MLKTLLKHTFLSFTLIASTLFADTTDVVWDASQQPGQLEAAIAAGGPGVYRLGQPSVTGGKWLTYDHVPVGANEAIHIIGADPTGDQSPVRIQVMANAEGKVGHTDGQMFNLVGDHAELKLENLILNAMAGGLEGNVGIAAARASHNKIIVDNCIISHVNFLAFHTMGKMTDFHIENSVIKQFTNGPGGMFYGGAIWGGGFWMGTIDTLVFRNNTVDGVIGEALVIYEHVDYGIVDHNTIPISQWMQYGIEVKTTFSLQITYFITTKPMGNLPMMFPVGAYGGKVE